MQSIHKICLLLLAAAVCLSITSCVQVDTDILQSPGENTRISDDSVRLPFDDISNSYARKQIVDLYNKGIVNGIDDRTFAPRQSITRAEFTALFLRVLKLKPANNAISAFADVPESEWYFGPIHAAVNLNLMNGTDARSFKPEKSITRQEAAVVLMRALKQEQREVHQITLPYTDAKEVGSWALQHVKSAEQTGLMQGFSGKFRPLEPISRQEAVVIFYRIMMNMDWAKQLDRGPETGIQLGWMYNQTEEQFKESVNNSLVNTISPRWFFLNASGQLTSVAKHSLVEWAHKNNKKVWPLVGNRFDREATHKLLADAKLRSQLAAQLIDFVKEYHLDGLNIDFENIDPVDRNAYSSFIKSLARELHTVGAVLSVDVPPDLGTDWSQPYNYAELGKNADYIVLMGYDEHWTGGGKAGSVSSIAWLENHIEKLTKRFPANKLIVGLPLYTRNWSQNKNQWISADLSMLQQNARINSLQAPVRWAPAAGQYKAVYKKDGVQHQIWAEDSRSLALKFRAGAALGVAGNAYWYIGSESPDVWTSLKNEMKYHKYAFNLE